MNVSLVVTVLGKLTEKYGLTVDFLIHGVLSYRVTTINVSRKCIEWTEWAASLCTANSPFPNYVYCRHPVQRNKNHIIRALLN